MQERPSVGATRSAKKLLMPLRFENLGCPFDLLEPIKSAPLWTEQATGVAAPTMLNRQRQKRHFHAAGNRWPPGCIFSLIINWRFYESVFATFGPGSHLDSGTGPIHPDLLKTPRSRFVPIRNSWRSRRSEQPSTRR